MKDIPKEQLRDNLKFVGLAEGRIFDKARRVLSTKDAERLASELAWYKGDPQGDLGRLNGELFRARRLVVDTGIHAKKWTREQSIAYGIPQSEVDRYVVMPGQACSYKIGQMKILELRDQAHAALGARFSMKDFHNMALSNGAIPLTLLEHVVKDWTMQNLA